MLQILNFLGGCSRSRERGIFSRNCCSQEIIERKQIKSGETRFVMCLGTASELQNRILIESAMNKDRLNFPIIDKQCISVISANFLFHLLGLLQILRERTTICNFIRFSICLTIRHTMVTGVTRRDGQTACARRGA